MKKVILISALAFALLIIPNMVLAQPRQPIQPGQALQQDVVQEPQGNQVQNQVETQNAGEDSQLNVNTQESLGIEEGSQNRSDTAREHMSEVAHQVEELLSSEDSAQGGIGQQVKQVAQQQKQAQNNIEDQLEKLESRQGIMKKLFGADQKAIKNLQRQLEQNQQRIQVLQELQTQVANQAEETQIQELVQALMEQNTALAEQIQAEEQVGSVFGWLVSLFN